MNPEDLICFIGTYFKENKEASKDIIDGYLNSDAMTIDNDMFIEMAPTILYSLYNFIVSSDHVPELIKNRVIEKENDFTALTVELIYIWTHGAIPLTFSWERSSKEFYRRILVPIRFNLSDIMYGALSTMRSQMSEMVYLESGDYAFVSGKEYQDGDDYTYLASDYAAYAIYHLQDARMCYGYDDAWVFTISLNHMRILDDKLAHEPLVLIDAAGFGIFEGNQENVLIALGDPMVKANSSFNAKDMLGVDFTKVNIPDIKANLKESFYLTQYRYEAKEEL